MTLTFFALSENSFATEPSSGSTRVFLKAQVVLNPLKSVTLKDLYTAYTKYSYDVLKKPTQTKRLFLKEVRQLLNSQILDGSIILTTRENLNIKGISLKEKN